MKKQALIALAAGVCLSTAVFAADSMDASASTAVQQGTPVTAPATPSMPSADANAPASNSMPSDMKNSEGKCSAGKCAAGQCSAAPSSTPPASSN